MMSRWMICLACRCSRPAQVCAVSIARCERADLAADARNLVLLERVIVDDVGQGTALHVVHDDPEFGLLDEVRVAIVDDVGVWAS